MKTLYLPLKKQWYEMIESGVKTEEYRAITTHWISRLLQFNRYSNLLCINHRFIPHNLTFKVFDVVKFSYGYTKRTMTFELEYIAVGKGNPEWGAPEEDVFIIKLGKRL